MKKAYVYTNNNGSETVIIGENAADARACLGIADAALREEPVRAYNTPDKNGIVIATSVKQLYTDTDVSMEYWDNVDAVIEKHVKACIKDLKKWSVKDVSFKSPKVKLPEEDIIFEISKAVGDVILEKMERWGGAEFPVVSEEEE